MNEQRFEPSDPREWLNRAQSNLERAALRTPNVYFEDLCFDAQQAAEKAIKSVLLHAGVSFPYIHDLDKLLKLAADAGTPVPDAVRDAGKLTRFAVVHRYPVFGSPVTDEEHQRAMQIATAVVDWARSVVGYDDIPLTAWIQPALTTVHQPLLEMAATASHMILDPDAASTLPPRVELATHLVVRESTTPPAGT